MVLDPGLTAPAYRRPATAAHGLLAATFGEPDADAFMAGLPGHEGIERDALRSIVGRDDRLLKALYFGNWQRDVSQFIVPIMPQVLGPERGRLLADLVFAY